MYVNKGEVLPLVLTDGTLIISVKVDRIIGFDAQLAL